MKQEDLLKVFEERAKQLARSSSEVAGSEGVEASWLLFEMGKMLFATDLEPVSEVVPIERLTPVPLAPALLSGLMNLRGAVVPAVDLGAFLGLPSQVYDRTAGLVCGDVSNRVVLVVGRVLDLLFQSRRELVGIPLGLPESTLPFLKDSTSDGVLVLNLPRIMEDSRLVFEPLRGGRFFP
jgi:purine-binding chemotaxis protein CheW